MEKRMQRRVVRKSREIRKNIFFVLTLVMIFGLGTLALGGQTEKKQRIYYESVAIEAGDTLWSIAQEYKAAAETTEHMVKTIQEFNHLKTANIRSGERLIVPVKLTE